MKPSADKPRIAFVSTRIAGTDGVSLEIEKWARVLERSGVDCYYIAGEHDRPADRSFLIEEAHFTHPEILEISRRAFDTEVRTSALSDDITRIARSIRDQLATIIAKLDLDAIIAENALTIPITNRLCCTPSRLLLGTRSIRR